MQPVVLLELQTAWSPACLVSVLQSCRKHVDTLSAKGRAGMKANSGAQETLGSSYGLAPN